jgi:hypothetical protein
MARPMQIADEQQRAELVRYLGQCIDQVASDRSQLLSDLETNRELYRA